MKTQVTIDIYRMKKEHRVNDEFVNRVGDIVIVDESGESGTAYNCTQKEGPFSPFAGYEKADQLASNVKIGWSDFINILHNGKELDRSLYMSKEDIEKADKEKLNAQTLSCLNQADQYLQLAENALRCAKTLNAGSNCNEKLLRELTNREFTVSCERGCVGDIKKNYFNQ